MDFLQKIVACQKEELTVKRRKMPQGDCVRRARDTAPARPFLQNFIKNEINIIAEVKKASPSAGLLHADYRPVEMAQTLEEGGAVAISVLTNSHSFQGRLADLEAVKNRVKLPCLQKDFIIDEYHIYEARAHEADAILLIATILDGFQLADYIQLIEGLGMTALVEVHDGEELAKILKYNIKLLGINNRNLKTLKTDIKTSEAILSKVPKSVQVISESGLNSHDILLKLKRLGFIGFLIGEAFMRIKNLAGMKTELFKLRGK